MVITKEKARELLGDLYAAEASNPAPKSKAKAKARVMPKIVETEGVEPEDVPAAKPKTKAAPKAKAKIVVTPEEIEQEEPDEEIPAAKPKAKAASKARTKVLVTPEEVESDEEIPAAKPKAKAVAVSEEAPKPKAKKAKGTKVREGWEKGKKVYTIESIEPLGECSDFDSEKIPSTVRGENPSGAAKKVFTQIRKVVKDESPDAEILPFYRLTLVETPPVKGEGRFVYDAQTILLDEPKERRIESSNGKTSVIPIYYEYKVKAVKETHDEEKKGAAKKAKGTPKAKNAKVKEDVKLDHYKKAAETPIPEDEPVHDEVSEEVPPVKKAPKGAPKASAKGKL